MKETRNVLFTLEVDSSLRGYDLILISQYILKNVKNKKLMNKELLNAIEELTGNKPKNIERDIIYLIEKCWKKRKIKKLL